MSESVHNANEKWRHPRGLATVFMVEMWERSAFYGMRAILVLFLVAAVEKGGLGLSDQEATAIYGLYTASALLFGLLGGWASDRYLGAQRAVAAGGWLILAGNLLLIVGAYQTIAPLCFTGLAIDALGVGFLKPNASGIVAELYPQAGAQRDAGFSLFYTGINIGALIGSLGVPFIAARFGWWSGFLATVIGMAFGLAQYSWTRHQLGQAGARAETATNKFSWGWLIGIAAIIFAAITAVRVARVDAVTLSRWASWSMLVVAVGYFAYLFTRPELNADARKNLLAMIPLCVGVIIYLIGYQQGGSSLSLFVQRYTDRVIAGHEIPAGAFQSILPTATVIFAPLFAVMWLWLGKRKLDPSPFIKFGVALLLMGAGFLVMSLAARAAASQGLVVPTWILLTFLLHTFADLFIAPVGLSAASKLAPRDRLGQTMGLWFVATAVGNSLSGLLAGQLKLTDAAALSAGFLRIFLLGTVAALVMVVLSPFIMKLSGRNA